MYYSDPELIRMESREYKIESLVLQVCLKSLGTDPRITLSIFLTRHPLSSRIFFFFFGVFCHFHLHLEFLDQSIKYFNQVNRLRVQMKIFSQYHPKNPRGS